MAAVNSLLFLLASTTLAPLEQTPYGDYATTSTDEPDWMKNSLSKSQYGDYAATATDEPDWMKDSLSTVNPDVQRQGPDFLNCRPDEEESCFSHCQPNCTNYNLEINCPVYCVWGCVCKTPLIRGPGDSCILPEMCPPLQSTERLAQPLPPYIPPAASLPPICGPGEEFSYCGALCQKNCDNYDKEQSCIKLCVPGCVCKEPLIRAADRSCVMPEQCHPQTPSSSTPSDYEPTYEEEPKDDEVTTELSNDLQDLLRQHNPYECKENERLDICVRSCSQEDCYNYGRDMTLEEGCSDMCFPACVCTKPYIRGPDGNCILYEECPNYTTPPTDSENATANAALNAPQGEDGPLTCPENEEYVLCGPVCEKSCVNLGVDEPCGPGCKAGCVCKPGFVRGFDHRCVPEEKCVMNQRSAMKHSENDTADTAPNAPQGEDGPLTCPENEEYVLCGPVCEKSCVNLGVDEPCGPGCKAGCVCKPGFVRGFDHRCVPEEKCVMNQRSAMKQPAPGTLRQGWLPDLPELKCRGENEEFSFCASVCPDNCVNYQTERLCNKICVLGCRCKKGYVLGKNGSCMKQEYCEEQKPEDCLENEYYDECGSYCETDCFNHTTPNLSCKNKQCKKGCFCKPGLVRAADWSCVPPNSCPARSVMQTFHSLRYIEKNQGA